MTHTRTCENATNRECFCDCGGSLHGRNPRHGVVEMKEGYQDSGNPHNDDEKEIEKDWNNTTFSNRLFTLGPATGIVKDRDEAQFASHSSWDELSPETKRELLKNSDLVKYSLKYGTRGKS